MSASVYLPGNVTGAQAGSMRTVSQQYSLQHLLGRAAHPAEVVQPLPLVTLAQAHCWSGMHQKTWSGEWAVRPVRVFAAETGHTSTIAHLRLASSCRLHSAADEQAAVVPDKRAV